MKTFDKTVVLTGGTGNFGRFLASELLKHDVQLVMLVRANSKEEARARVKNIIDLGGDRVQVLHSDLTLGHLGLSEKEYLDLTSRTTHILHAAASIRFKHSIEDARRHNVKTTERMVHFGKECPSLIRFGFVSTALVAGKQSGIIMENEFEHEAGFKNTYEQTKYEAEAFVRSKVYELPIVILRPSLIITPPLEGHKISINLLALAVPLLARGYLPFVPGTEKSTIDVVNGTDAARVMCELLLKKQLSHLTYHITNGHMALTVKTIHSMIEQKLGKSIPLEFCGDMKSFRRRVQKIPWYKPAVRAAYKRTASFLPEAAFPKIFDNHNTLSELGIGQIGEDPNEIFRTLIYKGLWNF